MVDLEDDILLLAFKSKRPRKTATPTSNPGRATALGEVDEVQERVKSAPNHFGKRKSLSMTLSDPDLLDCSFCRLPLRSPVYQCENGHMVCKMCCSFIPDDICSSCSLPIGNIRCRPIEKLIESLKVTCEYNAFGCTEILSYSEKFSHENSCSSVPCSCPIIGCNFVGSSKHLYTHFSLQHKGSFKPFDFECLTSISMKGTDGYVILRERSRGELFVVNCCTETFGSLFNVVCVAPPSPEKRWYELIADMGGDTIKLGSFVEMTPKWTEQTRPAKMCVAVPSKFISITQQIELKIVIWKNPGLPLNW